MAQASPIDESTRARTGLTFGAFAAFFAIYFLWGTTFFAIRVAVREIPPLFAAGTRMLLAGVILLGFMKLRGATRPTVQQWRSLSIMGVLMFAVNYAGLFWAEKYLSSGIAAVVGATIPLMVVACEILFGLQAFRWTAMAAVLLGFCGVGVLMIPDARLTVPVLPVLAIIVGVAGWSLGTVWSKKLPLPASKPVTAGASMMIGGAVLLVFSAAIGEMHPWPHISRSAGLALAYLVTFGSLIAYTAYVWLLSHMPASTVASYAYVNPVVAVVLGHFVADEVITPRMLVGAALVLVSVYLILRLNRQTAKV
ncbi:MAG: EamA family transporter [Edaphobacter sp.]|uniref:EamA family transporter n=1 Tax=Edaphobacter sp. TaxID=1934404 RepID=UPI00239797AF|nr:EamA family transporter [Edaphobacter sp.]MDE1176932.1 EamA family transporter [Edaphobacter sp.]